MADEAQTSGGSSAEGSLLVPVHREELRIGTRSVDTGKGVRVRIAVQERPQLVEQTLWRDEVEFTRVPVDEIVPLAAAPVSRYEGDTLIVPVLEEVLVVEKRLCIKEELRITRRRHAVHHCETVLLKSEQVTAERFDEASEMHAK